jgi:phospholipase A1/A2
VSGVKPYECGLYLALILPGQAFAQNAAPDTQGAAQRERAPAAPSEERATPQSPAKDEPEIDVLTFHRSNYFVTGFTRDTQVKFQFSFKYDLWPSAGRHTVYLAYTQKSLWDLYDTSSPFRESNYAPEIFYAHYHSDRRGQPNPGCGLFSEQAGVEHESNGEASDASRSWNRIFVGVEATCYGEPLYGLLGVRAWYPFALGENPKVLRSQGYGELLLGVGIDEEDAHSNGLLTVALRKGTSRQVAKGSVTIDARWRPTYQRLIGKAWKFAPYLWTQLFTGYGETLGTYDQATTSFRVGVGFSDRAR